MESSAPYTRIVEVYESLVVDDVYSAWADFVVDALASGGGPITRVLDIGCGTGLLAEQLIARGLHVSGVDASDDMLARARDRLGSAADLAVATLPDITVEGPFDAAVSTFDTFNYLTPIDLDLSLRAISAELRTGAILVFDVHTDAMMDFSVNNPEIVGEQAGWCYELLTSVDTVTRSCVSHFSAHPSANDPEATTATGTVPAAAASGAFAEQHTQYFHSDEAIESALDAAGFEVLARTDEYTSAPVTQRTLRATWTARKVR